MIHISTFLYPLFSDNLLQFLLFWLGIMGSEEEHHGSTSPAVTSTADGDNQAPTSSVDVPLQPVPPIIAPALVVPPLAPIPAVPAPAVLRPQIPPPVRPSVLRQKNGQVDKEEEDTAAPGSKMDYEISEESRQVRERHEKAMQDLMMKRRAAALAVPTNDKSVRARLRRLGEPMTLFGEREMERRDRLRMIMAKLDADGQLEKLMKAHEEEEAAASTAGDDMEEDMLQYPFFTEGSRALLEARINIAKFSVARAATRLQRARRKRDDPDEDTDAEIDWALRQAGSLVLDCSEIGGSRLLQGCSFSHDGTFLATWYVFFFFFIYINYRIFQV